MTPTEHLGDLIRPLLRRNCASQSIWTTLPVETGTRDEQEQSWARTFVELVLMAERVGVVPAVLDVLDNPLSQGDPAIAMGRLRGAYDLWGSVDQKKAAVYATRAWVQACPCLPSIPALVKAGVGDPR